MDVRCIIVSKVVTLREKKRERNLCDANTENAEAKRRLGGNKRISGATMRGNTKLIKQLFGDQLCLLPKTVLTAKHTLSLFLVLVL